MEDKSGFFDAGHESATQLKLKNFFERLSCDEENISINDIPQSPTRLMVRLYLKATKDQTTGRREPFRGSSAPSDRKL